MIRILVVEDSPTTRDLLTAALGQDADLRVVAQACDGRQAIDLTHQFRPDLVTMDIDLPRLDGLAATREIMATTPTPIVIVSGLARTQTTLALDALQAGALAVLPKPPGPGTPGFPRAVAELIETVKMMAQVKVVRHWRPVRTSPAAATGRPGAVHPQVIAMAASTGGPVALQAILADLPANLGLPVVVVQHISPGFGGGLAAWLAARTPLRVKVAEHAEPLVAGTVYLAPDDRHLVVSGRQVQLGAGPAVGGFRPSASVLFESAAQAFGPAVLAVILTGMGDDGLTGLRAVRRSGGWVIAQDEASCVVYGMPGAAVAAGLADSILPLDAIASRLAREAGAGRTRP